MVSSGINRVGDPIIDEFHCIVVQSDCGSIWIHYSGCGLLQCVTEFTKSLYC